MKMNITTPRIPSGFNEYLPAEQIEFNRLLDIVRSVYEKYGFAPLDTPILELSEVLLAKGGGETEQQVYRFERGRNDLTMRYDLTVPLARYVAQHEGALTIPFRRYQIGKVYRAERAQAGRFREFYQCDIDVIGSRSTLIDAELPVIINEIFERFEFGEFTIRLNNRMILNGFFEALGLSEQSKDVLRVVDKIEKISVDSFVDELTQLGLTQEQIATLQTFVSLSGTNDEVLASLESLGIDSPDFRLGIEKLSELVASLRAMKVPESRFLIDLKIARGLDYYTGTVYETILDEHPSIGSVCSGGRYDDLASHYSKTQLPGVGVSIGLTRLFYQLKEAGLVTADTQSLARVVVLPMTPAEYSLAGEVATDLRSAGVATILYSEPNDLSKKMKYVDKMGCQYAVVIGADEARNSVVSIKDMRSGEQRQAPLDDFVASLADLK
ncbi:MAG: histidine--tRNA ligase [Candidatus Saccharibacteria bacterium]|nr:histidine--tRNA ligase [Candidatus Saccharibacteria bacterium]